MTIWRASDFTDIPAAQQARFWFKVDEVGDCWIWTAALTAAGYGAFRVRPRLLLAHRFSWRLAHGRWPHPGMQLDHLCRQRACVRPEHLEEVTPAVNVQRGMAPAASRERQLAITHCPRGHEYSPENTYRPPNNQRQCRTCRRAWSRDRQRAKRAAGA